MTDSHRKPVVQFIGEPTFIKVESPTHGDYEYARVHGLNHPRLGQDHIRTSMILKKFFDGSFETMNTIYVPLSKENAHG